MRCVGFEQAGGVGCARTTTTKIQSHEATVHLIVAKPRICLQIQASRQLAPKFHSRRCSSLSEEQLRVTLPRYHDGALGRVFAQPNTWSGFALLFADASCREGVPLGFTKRSRGLRGSEGGCFTLRVEFTSPARRIAEPSPRLVCTVDVRDRNTRRRARPFSPLPARSAPARRSDDATVNTPANCRRAIHPKLRPMS